MSLRRKKKQLIAAALAAVLTVSAAVPALAANAPAVFAVEEDDYTDAPQITSNGFRAVENADGTLTIIGFSEPYEGDAEYVKVTFPAMLDGKKVTKIGSWVLVSLFERIDDDHKLPKVYVDIEDGITEIGAFAFRSISVNGSRNTLEIINIPASVKKIGYSAFDYCPYLQQINVASNNKYYTNLENDGVLYNKDMTELIRYPAAKEDLTYAPFSGVQTIGRFAFQGCTNLESVNFQVSDLTTIEAHAFFGCTGLTSFILPDNVQQVDTNVFSECSSLEKIFVPYTVKSFSLDSLLDTKGENGFATVYYEGSEETWQTIASDEYASDDEKEALKKIKVVTPKDEEEWKNRPKYDPNGGDEEEENRIVWDDKAGFTLALSNIPVPQEEKTSTSFWIDVVDSKLCVELTDDAFVKFTTGCPNVETLGLPTNVKLGENTLSKITKLKTIYYSGTDEQWAAIVAAAVGGDEQEGQNDRNTPAQLVVPEGVDVICDSDFAYENVGTEELKLLGCLLTNEEITTTLNDQDPVLAVPDVVGGKTVTAIDDEAFAGCPMTEVRFSENCKIASIGKGAFSGCANLKSVDIPNSVTSLGAEVFAQCYALEQVTLPENLTAISDRMFENCANLANFTFPASLTVIGESAFQGCSKLTGVVFPKELSRIGENAFDSCTSLESVRFANDTDPNPDEDIVIGDLAFYNCTSLDKIVLPQGLATIKAGTFMNCTSLLSLWVPYSVQEIESYAFFGCATGDIKIENDTKTAGPWFFYQGTDDQWENIKKDENFIRANRDVDYAVMDRMAPSQADIVAGRNSITLNNIPLNIEHLTIWRESDHNELETLAVPDSGTVTFSGLSSGTQYRISGTSQYLDGEFGATLVTTQRKKSSSSRPSSSGSSSSSSNTPTVPAVTVETKPNEATTGVTGSVAAANGTARVNDAAVQEAIKKAQQTAQSNGTAGQGIAVTVPITNAGQSALAVTLPSGTLNRLVQAQVQSFEIRSEQISVKLDAAVLHSFRTQSPDTNLILQVMKPQTLSAAAQTAFGERPVYDVGLYRAAVTGGWTPVSNLNGTVTVKLSYTLAPGEDASRVGAVYADGSGNVQWLAQSRYDAAEKAVIFETDHLMSVYGIGYGGAGWASLTLDTNHYIMAPGNQYTIGAFLKDKDGNPLSSGQVQAMLANGSLAIRDSRTGSVMDLTQLPNGNVTVIGKNPGTAYVLYEVGGTRSSVRIDVENGVQQHGTAVRKTTYFQS